jgi:hypothetical protein
MQPTNGISITTNDIKRTPVLQRNWVTPFTLGAFMLSAVTGILLFFKVHIGLVKPAHEWLSWLMVIAAVFHLLCNRRSFVVTLGRPVAKVVVILFLLLLGGSLLPLGESGGHPRRIPTERIADGLIHAPLATVAAVANRRPEETIQLLWQRGINAQSSGQSIQEIAENNRQRAIEVLAIIFQG